MGNKRDNVKLRNTVRKTVVEIVHEVINDEEYGKELQDWVQKRLYKYSDVSDYAK